MKKISLTTIIIISGIAAAAAMLVHAYAPGTYKALSTIVFFYVLFGAAVLCLPQKSFSLNTFLTLLGSLLVIGVIAFLFEKLDVIAFAKVPVFALLGALAMILLKQNEFALPAAVFAAAASVYSAGNLITFELLSVAFSVASAAISERKFKCIPVKVAAVFLICLALCAFK